MEEISHEEINPIVDPETEEGQYPWMTSEGHPITKDGKVEGCNCPDCCPACWEE